MEYFIDENGNRHYTAGQIASDGQGVFYRAKGEGVFICDSSAIHGQKHKYIDAKLLPLESVENIIMPCAYLKEPYAGYIMLVPGDFSPLTEIMNHSHNKREFYAKTGGLKRRVLLMAELAKTLHMLHSVPCMYGPVMPHRMFIPTAANKTELFLLYSVNMTATMPFTAQEESNRYAAPEAKNGVATIHSDVYSFGRLAHDLFTMEGTFGETLDNSTRLRETLTLAMSDDPYRRPVMPDLHKCFLRVSDLLVSCKNCHRDFMYLDNKCPFCKKRLPKILKARIYDRVENKKVERGQKVFELYPGIQQCFWNYHTEHVLYRDSAEPRIGCMTGISSSKKLHFIVKNLMNKDLKANGKLLAPGQTSAITLPCESIKISFLLHAAVYRHIEMVFE